MAHHFTDAPSGPAWRVLILDRDDPDDPRWLIATVADPEDVRPAEGSEGELDPFAEPGERTRAWVASRGSHPHITLHPLPSARCWRLDGR
jgi:hypothetical protein